MMHETHLPDLDEAASSLGRKLLLTLALGALLALSWRGIGRTHDRRVGGRGSRPPRRLQRWEGEGGRPTDDDGWTDVDGLAAGGTAPGPR